jgi:hypothetical protein
MDQSIIREVDPGGLGACPQENHRWPVVLLFPEKEAKSVVLLRRSRTRRNKCNLGNEQDSCRIELAV